MINQTDVKKLLFDFSQMNPDKKAIICNDQSVSYSELWDIVVSLTEELKRFGIGKGLKFAIKRLLRCNPFNDGISIIS